MWENQVAKAAEKLEGKEKQEKAKQLNQQLKQAMAIKLNYVEHKLQLAHQAKDTAEIWRTWSQNVEKAWLEQIDFIDDQRWR